MALQFIYTTPSDITLPPAYVHIASFGGTKGQIQVQLTVWKDIAAFTAKKQPVGNLQARLILEDGATFAQMYTALKLQAPFIGAINV